MTTPGWKIVMRCPIGHQVLATLDDVKLIHDAPHRIECTHCIRNAEREAKGLDRALRRLQTDPPPTS
jgi:hypothetical protein